MKTILTTAILAAILLAATSALRADDLPAVTLGKVLAAVEHAHSTHKLAEESCAIRKHHEIGWDAIEKDTRDLANTQPTPKASKLFIILFALREERKQLFGDYLGCAAKLNTSLMTSIQNDLDSLDDVAWELETNLEGRVQTLEYSVDWCAKHPAK